MGVLIAVCCVVLNVHSHAHFCNHLDGEERAGCFAWFVFLIAGDGSVAMGLSLVCNCGIF